MCKQDQFQIRIYLLHPPFTASESIDGKQLGIYLDRGRLRQRDDWYLDDWADLQEQFAFCRTTQLSVGTRVNYSKSNSGQVFRQFMQYLAKWLNVLISSLMGELDGLNKPMNVVSLKHLVTGMQKFSISVQPKLII